MTKRVAVFIYGVASYAIFFATFLYAIGFIGNLFVPVTIDGAPRLPTLHALLVDAALLGAFAVQHSVMARPGFKRIWTRIVPPAAERSTYVLVASLLLIATFAFWQPLGGTIWRIDNPVGQGVAYALYGLGWVVVLLASFLINHFDLFGLRQSWLYLRGKEYTQLKFGTPWLYKMVRHPLYVGWLLVFWATPTMSVTHLVFAVLTTAYILIAIQLEERDLARIHPEYSAYRKRVPMLVPKFFGRSRSNPPTTEAA